jgi:tRNA A37 threonylcarbamoyladenosine synthetase subunit TsaC/SUA5/YrdC
MMLENHDDDSRDARPDARMDPRALDSDADAGAEERFVRAVMARVAHFGGAPAIPTDPLYGLWSLPRPLLLVASVIALAVLGAAVGTQRARAATPSTIADATGIPPVFLATGANRP